MLVTAENSQERERPSSKNCTSDNNEPTVLVQKEKTGQREDFKVWLDP